MMYEEEIRSVDWKVIQRKLGVYLFMIAIAIRLAMAANNVVKSKRKSD